MRRKQLISHKRIRSVGLKYSINHTLKKHTIMSHALKINKRQFIKWINALDSKEYKQSAKALQNYYGYCCLGVACAVIIPENKLELNEDGHIEGALPIYQEYAPKWLAEINTDFHNKTEKRLAYLNDAKGFTFSEIATLL